MMFEAFAECYRAEAFLRMQVPGPFLFISHVAEDRATAVEIVEELERRGIRCWIAPRNVRPGRPFDDEIVEAIEASAALLLIFSARCNESEYIRREVTVAGESQRVIVPFRIEDTQPKRGLRVRLSDLHWIDGFVSRERAIDELVRTFHSPSKEGFAAAYEAPDERAHVFDNAGAERRQVTVVFSDLVGSTALSTRVDPEDLHDLLAAYRKCVADIVRPFGGYIAKYMGDGVLMYFGYPEAHEDDPERAVRAGLELTAAVSALKLSAPLQARVGVATGLVIVGDLIGSGEARERGIVGETPNLAARLQGIAEPNMVVIAQSTRKLLGDVFELQDLGANEIKGFAEPVRAWAALRPALVEGRFEALHAGDLTPLVGREEEIELLLRRWSKAKGGEGQVVLLSGEPGIGKSWLTTALLKLLVSEPQTRLRYFCSPQHTDSAFYPIITCGRIYARRPSASKARQT